jgi:uncharacterized protein YgbK (DUF1537 family)
MRSPRVALISDDLTGALDAAAPFAGAGWRTVVATAPEHLAAALAAGAEILAVSLNSRDISADDAAMRAGQAAAALAAVPILFKKIDSRMKGHVGRESSAVAVVRGLSAVVICPAIPELGRVVREGAVQGLGLALPLPVAAHAAVPPGLAADCPDAVTDTELDRIVAAAGSALLVGARGLAAALARSLGLPPVPQREHRALDLPIAFVIGSRDPITLAQIDPMCGHAAPIGLRRIAAPDGVVADAGPLLPVTVLQAVPGGGAKEAAVAAQLARGAVQTVLPGQRCLVLTGGETAAAVLRDMQVGVLLLLGEVEPGLPVSLPLDFPDAPTIVTKSGGFGDAGCLTRILQLAAKNGKHMP